jgi:ATP-dependent Zn protease
MEHSNKATAYHEAGHAVVALALGRPVNRVTIEPDQKRAGLCEFRKGTFRPSDDWLEREILIALGGVAAEAPHTGNYAWDGAARDERLVHSLARCLATLFHFYETRNDFATGPRPTCAARRGQYPDTF